MVICEKERRNESTICSSMCIWHRLFSSLAFVVHWNIYVNDIVLHWTGKKENWEKRKTFAFYFCSCFYAFLTKSAVIVLWKWLCSQMRSCFFGMWLKLQNIFVLLKGESFTLMMQLNISLSGVWIYGNICFAAAVHFVCWSWLN